jgi:hypothetical protein
LARAQSPLVRLVRRGLEFGHFAEIFNKGLLPLLGGGAAAPYKQMSRYLGQGAAGEVSLIRCIALSDLPGRADSKVARHLLDRRVRPSSKEGIADSRLTFRIQDQTAGDVRTSRRKHHSRPLLTKGED